MNNLKKTTLTTLEVAEMMETDHKTLLRKLEGGKGRKGYIQIIAERQMAPSDYFTPATYQDANNRTRPCYEVTKLGCDFLANKSTGEKGVLFTARYVKRFYEMEHAFAGRLDSAVFRNAASAGCLIERTMNAQGSKPYEVTKVLDSMFRQAGIILPAEFVKLPDFEQLSLFEGGDAA